MINSHIHKLKYKDLKENNTCLTLSENKIKPTYEKTVQLKNFPK